MSIRIPALLLLVGSCCGISLAAPGDDSAGSGRLPPDPVSAFTPWDQAWHEAAICECADPLERWLRVNDTDASADNVRAFISYRWPNYPEDGTPVERPPHDRDKIGAWWTAMDRIIAHHRSLAATPPEAPEPLPNHLPYVALRDVTCENCGPTALGTRICDMPRYCSRFIELLNTQGSPINNAAHRAMTWPNISAQDAHGWRGRMLTPNAGDLGVASVQYWLEPEYAHAVTLDLGWVTGVATVHTNMRGFRAQVLMQSGEFSQCWIPVEALPLPMTPPQHPYPCGCHPLGAECPPPCQEPCGCNRPVVTR